MILDGVIYLPLKEARGRYDSGRPFRENLERYPSLGELQLFCDAAVAGNQEAFTILDLYPAYIWTCQALHLSETGELTIFNDVCGLAWSEGRATAWPHGNYYTYWTPTFDAAVRYTRRLPSARPTELRPTGIEHRYSLAELPDVAEFLFADHPEATTDLDKSYLDVPSRPYDANGNPFIAPIAWEGIQGGHYIGHIGCYGGNLGVRHL